MLSTLYMILFVLQIAFVYLLWLMKKNLEKYFSVKSGAYFRSANYQSYQNRKDDSDFYKNFYDKTESNTGPSYNDPNGSNGGFNNRRKSKEDMLKDRLKYRDISMKEFSESLTFFNIEKLPIKEKEIKKMYREYAKKHHPDSGGNEEDFTNFQYYYNILENANEIAKNLPSEI